jgi:hypothetical protein
MLTSIGLENFQSIEGKRKVRLAPITLVFGPNASGKSSIARALKLVGQTIKDREQTFDGFLFDGPQIKLSTFAAVANGQGTANELTDFSVLVGGIVEKTNRFPVGIKDFELVFRQSPEKNGKRGDYRVSYSFGFDSKIIEKFSVTGFTLSTSPDESRIELSPVGSSLENLFSAFDQMMMINPVIEEEGDENYGDTIVFSTPEAELLNWPAILELISATLPYGLLSLRSFGLQSRPDEDKYKARFLETLVSAVNLWTHANLSQALFVEPIRPLIPRISDKSKPYGSGSLRKINEWLGKMTDERFEVGQSSFSIPGSPHKGLTTYVKDHATQTTSGFDEVGTGISQTVPVLAAMFPAPTTRTGFGRRSFSYIEQPELHLHPKAQSVLADAMIESAVTGKKTHQVIVETHSENILLRLQRRIREGIISKDDVAIIYVEGIFGEEGNFLGTVVENLDLSAAGDILDPFPTSFADLRIQDLL